MKVVAVSALAPGFSARKLRVLLKNYPGRDLMLVGHEPDFSLTLCALTGGTVKMAKGGVACVSASSGTLRGELLWLLTPKLCGA